METFRTEFGLDAAAGQWYYGLDLDYGPLKEFMGGGLWPFGSRQAASLANFTGSINTPKGSKRWSSKSTFGWRENTARTTIGPWM